MLNGINHITLAVRDLETSFHFYTELLGMRPHARWNEGAYLTLGGIWFCLSCDDSRPAGDYTHIALDIAQKHLPTMRSRLQEADVPFWKDNKSEGDSLYILDPDGHKLEIHVGSLQSRLASLREHPYDGLIFF